jgi:L-threonylcarbamoyladenylate synthase
MIFEEDIKAALATLKNGGVILYPTDTVWGIGCDATNETAVAKVYALKKRTDSKAMLVLVASLTQLENCVSDVPEIAYDLLAVADRPLTIIYPAARNLADSLLAEDGSIGVRITTETFSKRLCEQFHKPLVSTSANISGRTSPAIFDEIADEIKQGVDYTVRYRQDDTTPAAPSSIIRLESNGSFKIIRK